MIQQVNFSIDIMENGKWKMENKKTGDNYLSFFALHFLFFVHNSSFFILSSSFLLANLQIFPISWRENYFFYNKSF